MSYYPTILLQFLKIISWDKFQRCVDKYDGDKNITKLDCKSFFRIMIFAQLTRCTSLSDIVLCLKSKSKQQYHLGIADGLTKSNLAKANNKRNWKIFHLYARTLIKEATHLYKKEKIKDLEITSCVYALDSTVIDLCLSLFPWAHFTKTKSAVKMHTLMNLQGKIPDFILISTGKMADVEVMDFINWEAGSWYVMDRGYIDFHRLYKIHQSQSWFVTRMRSNTSFKRIYSRQADRSKGILCDQKIRLTGIRSKITYPERLRRIKCVDSETGKKLVFITNNFLISAEDIAKLYKNRWHIELFFKWMKQHLRIKSFYGRSDNAVRSQLWIAVCVYVMLTIIKVRLKLSETPRQILHILGMSIFEKTPILSLFDEGGRSETDNRSYNQLELFN